MKSTEIEYNDMIIKMANKIKNANKRGLEFTMTLTQFKRLFSVGVCQYSGREFDDVDNMSIERIDPELGYTKDNCILVRSELNMKRSAFDDLLRDKELSNTEMIGMMKYAMIACSNRINKKINKG